ncbi:hypothetical protein QEN19_002898 [Hanseniaspora menglaensis]
MSLDTVKDIIEELKALKKGVSAKRINKVTEFALNNLQLEDSIVDLIIDYSKTGEVSHKVGSLYLIDSLGRGALSNCNDLGLNILEDDDKVGTLQHIIKKFGDNINNLINDSYEKVTEEDQSKIEQLIDVWISEGLFTKQQLSLKSKDVMDDSDKKFSFEEGGDDIKVVDVKSGISSMGLKEVLPKDVSVKVLSGNTIPDLDKSLSDATNAELQKESLKTLLHFLNNNTIELHVTKNIVEEPANVSAEKGDRRHNIQNNHTMNSYNNNNNQQYENYGNTNNGNNSFSRDTMSLIPGEKNLPGSAHHRNKPVLHDSTCPMNSVKVMSRTLFIGGINSRDTKKELVNRLKAYGEIQTCFLNNKKGHGFVKAYSRAEAENIIKTFNVLSSQDQHELRVRWALGFGPRAYFNFDTGISTVPLYVVTDSEKEWAKLSEWGGTNGKEMVSGMLFEEPDYNPNETSKINNKRLDFQAHGNISNKPLSQRKATELARTNPEVLNQRYAQQQQFLYGQQPPQQSFPGLVPPPPQQMHQMYGNPGGNNNKGMYYQQPQQQPMYNGNMQQQYMYGNNQQPMYNNMSPPQQQQMYSNNGDGSQQNQHQPSANQLNNLMNLLNQQQK